MRDGLAEIQEVASQSAVSGEQSRGGGLLGSDPGLISTVLLSGEPQAIPGTSEEKLGVLQHRGLLRRPLPSTSWSLCLCTIKTDKKGLTAECQTECLMQ